MLTKAPSAPRTAPGSGTKPDIRATRQAAQTLRTALVVTAPKAEKTTWGTDHSDMFCSATKKAHGSNLYKPSHLKTLKES